MYTSKFSIRNVQELRMKHRQIYTKFQMMHILNVLVKQRTINSLINVSIFKPRKEK